MFVPSVDGDRLALSADDLHHLRRVLRLGDGDEVEASDGRGAVVRAVLAGDQLRPVGAVGRRPRPVPALWVLQALPKGRRFDELLRALVELGVDRVTPVAAERSVTQLHGHKRERAHERWVAVARAAAEQSRRAWLAEVDPVREVTDVAAGGGLAGVVAHVAAERPLESALRSVGGAPVIAIAVGPEGGWTDREVATWCDAGLVTASLGPSVLRTEHAAFAAAAAVAFATGRMAPAEGQ